MRVHCPNQRKEAIVSAREPSGFFYPNKMGRIYIMGIEEVLGKNGLNAVLHLAKLDSLIDNYPPNNLDREFDFADLAALDAALDDMVGPRGGRALSLRAGQALFGQGLQGFAAFVGMADLAFRLLPLSVKMKVGLRAMAEVFSKFSDQKTHVIEKEDRYLYVIERCPVCWGRHAEKPVCHVATGIIMEGLKWISGGKAYRVQETTCVAKGDDTCTFEIQKQPIN
jgi:hypothetical protein